MIKVNSPRLLSIPALLFAGALVIAEDRAPQYPFRVEGICPFECCQYGKWKAGENIPVYSAERVKENPLLTIGKDEEFVSEGGAVRTIEPLILRTRQEVQVRRGNDIVVESPHRARWLGYGHVDYTTVIRVPAGSTLHVIAYLGEGAVRALWRGIPVAMDSSAYAPIGGIADESHPYEILSPKQAPCHEKYDLVTCSAIGYYTPQKTEWWIKVKVKVKGKSGWIERGDYNIDGTDACG